MEKYSFFNDENNDRVYLAEDFAEYFIPFFTNGIFNNSCKVKSGDDGMYVNVEAGRAFINGYRYQNDSDKRLTIENADGVLNRIDNIVIRLDLVERTITALVVKGEFNGEPTAPALVRDSVTYDLRLAEVSIPAGTTEITQDLITDKRLSREDCGDVISPIETPDTEELFIQIQAAFQKVLKESNAIIDQLKTDTDNIIDSYDRNLGIALKDYKQDFDEWFSTIKNTLSGDVAGQLAGQISEVNSRVDTLAQKASTAYLYKGTVATYDDLENKKKGVEIGYVYNVEEDGMNYAWDGEDWDNLGSIVDLTNYATQQFVQDEIKKRITTVLEASY